MKRWLVLLALLASTAFAAPPDPKPLDVDGVRALRAAYAGKPYVLSFWSVHCEPCREEMTLLREMHAKHPEVAVVLVAMDPPAELERIRRFLARYDPGPVDGYRFADEYEERMRYAVDPKWRGEMPRSYFVDATGKSQPHSGVPDPAWLAQWFAQAGVK